VVCDAEKAKPINKTVSVVNSGPGRQNFKPGSSAIANQPLGNFIQKQGLPKGAYFCRNACSGNWVRILAINPTQLRISLEGIATRYASLGLTPEWAWLGCRPDAWRKRVASTFFGVPVHFISLDDLLANKQALGRSSDLKDLKQNPKGAKSEK
jgi:hypothetical protein